MITPNVLIPFESKSDHRLAVTHVKISDPSCSSSALFKTCVEKEVDTFVFGSLLRLTRVFNQFPSKYSACHKCHFFPTPECPHSMPDPILSSATD